MHTTHKGRKLYTSHEVSYIIRVSNISTTCYKLNWRNLHPHPMPLYTLIPINISLKGPARWRNPGNIWTYENYWAWKASSTILWRGQMHRSYREGHCCITLPFGLKSFTSFRFHIWQDLFAVCTFSQRLLTTCSICAVSQFLKFTSNTFHFECYKKVNFIFLKHTLSNNAEN